MIYNKLDNYVEPEKGCYLIRTLDMKKYYGRVYLTFIRELFQRKLDKAYKLKSSDFIEKQLDE